MLDSDEAQELVGRLMENTLLNTIREAAGGSFDVTSQPLNLHQQREASRAAACAGAGAALWGMS